MALKEPKIVGGYIRVSTEEQSRKGLSLESQKTDIEEYCKRNGYHLNHNICTSYDDNRKRC